MVSNRSSMADEFFDDASFNKHSHWVLWTFGIITLAVLALPFIWAFTGWL